MKEGRNEGRKEEATQRNAPVEGGGEEVAAVMGEVDVADALAVAEVRAAHAAGVVAVPDLDLAVVGRAQQQVARVGEPANGLYALAVAREAVDELLGDEAVMHLVALVGQPPRPPRRLQPGAALVIRELLLLAVPHARGLCGGGVLGVPRGQQVAHLALVAAVHVVVHIVLVDALLPLLRRRLAPRVVLRLDLGQQL